MPIQSPAGHESLFSHEGEGSPPRGNPSGRVFPPRLTARRSCPEFLGDPLGDLSHCIPVLSRRGFGEGAVRQSVLPPDVCRLARRPVEGTGTAGEQGLQLEFHLLCRRQTAAGVGNQHLLQVPPGWCRLFRKVRLVSGGRGRGAQTPNPILSEQGTGEESGIQPDWF
jgi:hypothetical protein